MFFDNKNTVRRYLEKIFKNHFSPKKKSHFNFSIYRFQSSQAQSTNYSHLLQNLLKKSIQQVQQKVYQKLLKNGMNYLLKMFI